MELLRATVVLLGVSMFFSIITSVLTASEELRVNFPSGKYLNSLNKSTEESPENTRMGDEEQDKTKDPDERRNVDDVESGNIDTASETIDDDKTSQAMDNSVTVSKNVDEEEPIQNGKEKEDLGAVAY